MPSSKKRSVISAVQGEKLSVAHNFLYTKKWDFVTNDGCDTLNQFFGTHKMKLPKPKLGRGAFLQVTLILSFLAPELGWAKAHFWDSLEPGKDYLSDEVVVEIAESTESMKLERAGKNWEERVGRGSKTQEAIKLMRLADTLGCTFVKKLGTLPFYEFKIPKGKTPTQVSDNFESHSEIVKLAQPNGILHPTSYIPYSFPNDPYYQDGNTQWNLNITRLDRAWNTTAGGMNLWSQGNPSTWIAIVDSGINNTHEDLIGQTVTGYCVLDGTTITTDTDGHGTNVASVACVATNNGTGIAGGAIFSKVLPVKVFDTGLVNAANAATGVDWAANNGARIMVISYAGSSDWAPLRAACDNAYYNMGLVLTAATGNTGTLVTT